jgi:hypothetical protein
MEEYSYDDRLALKILQVHGWGDGTGRDIPRRWIEKEKKGCIFLTARQYRQEGIGEPETNEQH